jgi:hypothetical protein
MRVRRASLTLATVLISTALAAVAVPYGANAASDTSGDDHGPGSDHGIMNSTRYSTERRR